MANMKGILKIVSGIVTVGTGAVVALKGLKSRKDSDFKATTDDNEVIEDEELKELAEMEAATEEESEPETVEAEEIEEDS